ncbi:hypothetical protein [Nesterenkonia muleiensis]|uniref:hypothetical protein n=1 Tax=Nesterenkonia muleiensis TaxID=2282648 RepID=UPI000E75E078|nr:hypothetical protein [Nesterenkonia muleiensis]
MSEELLVKFYEVQNLGLPPSDAFLESAWVYDSWEEVHQELDSDHRLRWEQSSQGIWSATLPDQRTVTVEPFRRVNSIRVNVKLM